jgi:glycosyltransferase involved in cell wall biosynthesis
MVDVSVIIPTHDRKKWLQKAIESCAMQKGVTVEIIVIDDGGTDGTEWMVSNLPIPVQYKWCKNKGPGAARNIGMQMATGRYIKFLDSDDMLAEDALSSEVMMLDSTGADISYGKWMYCDQNDEVKEEVHGQYEGDFFTFLLHGDWYANFAFLFRADTLKKQSLYWDEDIFYIADFQYIFAVAATSPRFVFTPVCTGYYRKFSWHTCLSKSGPNRSASYVKILKNQVMPPLTAYQDILYNMKVRLLEIII